eukprot:COSAG02_NODE_6109_length_3791_cov_241.041441_2_plen_75_part_00
MIVPGTHARLERLSYSTRIPTRSPCIPPSSSCSGSGSASFLSGLFDRLRRLGVPALPGSSEALQRSREANSFTT